MLGDVDYNGWSPDSPFVFDNTAWTSSLSFPADYKTFWTPRDVTLHASSNAVDAGLVIPNISDGLMGSAPDLGAWERGRRF